jgi:hypothetical protein
MIPIARNLIKGIYNTKESARTNKFIVPDKYLCEYDIHYNKDGGCSSTYQCWQLINKKLKTCC